MIRSIAITGFLALQSCITDPNGETAMHQKASDGMRFTTTCIAWDYGLRRAPSVPPTGCPAGQAVRISAWQWMAPNGDCEAAMLAGARMVAVETCAVY